MKIFYVVLGCCFILKIFEALNSDNPGDAVPWFSSLAFEFAYLNERGLRA